MCVVAGKREKKEKKSQQWVHEKKQEKVQKQK